MSTKINDDCMALEIGGRPRDRGVPRTRRGRRSQRMDRLVSPRTLFTRNQAITAMVLAERLAVGFGEDDPFVLGWREGLGL